METFLQKTAKYIFSKHELGNLRKLKIVLPSRRSVFFFKHELGQLSENPFLAPEIFAIDDFVLQTTQLRQIEPVSLLFELFDIFKSIDPNIDFDRFVAWAPTLLQDFDKVDQYLNEDTAKALFAWVSDAKAIARWNIDPSQIIPASATDKYFKLFENIGWVYDELKLRLGNKKVVYRGMAYKILANDVYEQIIAKREDHYYYFVGFNALSDSEEKIIREIIKANLGEVLWDTDAFYMNNFQMEAGNLLRIYKGKVEKELHRKIGNKEWNWQANLLATSSKNIQVFEVANAAQQGKIASNILDEWKQKDIANQIITPKTAIILGDETLLESTLFSLNAEAADFNITMGQGLKSSHLFTLIDALFELQRNLVEFKNKENEVVKIPKYAYQHISKVLLHPLIAGYEKSLFTNNQDPNNEDQIFNPIKQCLSEMLKKNSVFLSEAELLAIGQNDKLFEIIFGRWNNSPQKAMTCFYNLIDILRPVFKAKKDLIQTEFLFVFYTVLNRLSDILSNRTDKIPFKSFKVFLYEFIKKEKIPFDGELLSELQIMGMLETRTLDYERIIVLSLNEGVLPQGKKNNSLIPLDAAIEFGLPTHGEMDAVMAYHFFRLLQRAKEVVLIHVLPGDTYGAGEKSRFLLQIEHELAIANKNINLTYPIVKFKENINKINSDTEISIKKTPQMIEQLLNQWEAKGLSPTHFNQYINCSLQFYFSKVVKLNYSIDVKEELGNDKFGNWIHATLEKIDSEFINNNDGIVNKIDLEKLIHEIPERLKTSFRKNHPGLRFDEGINYILFEAAANVLSNFYKFHIEKNIFPIKILEVEKKVVSILEFENKKIKIEGRIDRIDFSENALRIIDFKTGFYEPKHLTLKGELTMDALIMDASKDKLRQIWIYKYLTIKNIDTLSENISAILADKTNTTINAGIYSFRNIKADFMPLELQILENETNLSFIETSEEILKAMIGNILDLDQPFQRTQNVEACKFCNYQRICNREDLPRY